MLRNLAGLRNEQSISGLLQVAKNAMPSSGTESAKASGSNLQEPARPTELNITQPSSDVAHNFNSNAWSINLGNSSSLKPMMQFPSVDHCLAQQNESEAMLGRSRINNFDLNNVCDDECAEKLDKEHAYVNPGEGPAGVPEMEGKDLRRVSPTLNNSTSNSDSTQSPSSSSGEAQVHLVTVGT